MKRLRFRFWALVFDVALAFDRPGARGRAWRMSQRAVEGMSNATNWGPELGPSDPAEECPF